MTTTTTTVPGYSATQQQADATSPSLQSTDRTRATTGIWAGRVLSGLVIAFMLLASVAPKLFLRELAAESMPQLGWNVKHLLLIALLELAGTLLYAIPRTAVLGAVLLTGVFGGAIATHLRIDNPLLSHTLFPVYLGALMWAGLWLRDARLRALLPLITGNARSIACR